MLKSGSRADWTLHDSIIWIRFRNEIRLNNPRYRVPVLRYTNMYNSTRRIDCWVKAANALLLELRDGQKLTAKNLSEAGHPNLIAPGWWNRKSIGFFDDSTPDIVLSAAQVKAAFPSPSCKVRDLEPNDPVVAAAKAPPPPKPVGKYKGGNAQRDALIIAKVAEMKDQMGLDGRAIASALCELSEFRDVGVVYVRKLITGQFTQRSGKRKGT